MLYGLGPFSFLIKSEKIISRLNGPVFQIKLFKTLILKLNFKTFLVKPNNDLHAFARCTYNLALFKTEIFNYFSVEEESLSALSRYIQHMREQEGLPEDFFLSYQGTVIIFWVPIFKRPSN